MTDTIVHLTGLLAMLGACLYAIGDVLLLAPHVGPIKMPTHHLDVSAYPALQRRWHRCKAG